MQESFLDVAVPSVVTVYTDGGCDPNPGPGGWAAILCFPDHEVTNHEVTLTGNTPETTNNRMELEAAIAALAYLSGSYGPCRVGLYTDSEYLGHGITEWIDGWFASGWKTRRNQPVKNQDLWRKLYNLIHTHQVEWHWVKGHTGDVWNERADRLASEARDRLSTWHVRPSSPPVAKAQGSDGDHAHPQVKISIQVSCLESRGPCGWAAVLRSGRSHRTLCGHQVETTSNAALLQATIAGLKALKSPCDVLVYTVSDYLGKGAEQWVHGWQQRQWKTKEGKAVKNRELWEALIEAAEPHHVAWQVVRSDSLPDDLARAKDAAAQEAIGASSSRLKEV